MGNQAIGLRWAAHVATKEQLAYADYLKWCNIWGHPKPPSFDAWMQIRESKGMAEKRQK